MIVIILTEIILNNKKIKRNKSVFYDLNSKLGKKKPIPQIKNTLIFYSMSSDYHFPLR